MVKKKKPRVAKKQPKKQRKSAAQPKARAKAKPKRVARKGHRASVIQGRRPERRPPKAPVILERNPLAVKMYETALKSFLHEEFSKARELFQKVIEQFSKENEIVERSKIHLTMCQQRMTRANAGAKTAEDYYNLAIAHLNRREFDPAESALEKALSMEPKGDYIFYGLASLEALRGRAEPALKYLHRAIQINPQNRLAASRDADFEAIAQLPEFLELIRTPVGASE